MQPRLKISSYSQPQPSLVLPYTLLCIFTCIVLSMCYTINRTVTEPYMDELFHVDQVQRWCDTNSKWGNWNNKITTLPGLYLYSLSLVHTAHRIIYKLYSNDVSDISNDSIWCNLHTLRLSNLLLLPATIYLLYQILQQINPIYRTSHNIHIYKLLIIITHPIIYFYIFLYYTDLLSLFTVLLSVHLYLNNNLKLSGVVCTASVLTRQTNIVWCIFLLGWSVIHKYTVFSTLVVQSNSNNNQPQQSIQLLHPTQWSQLLPAFINLIRLCLNNFITIIKQHATYMLCILCFIVFVQYNGSIVVGDKTNHSASLHVVQLFYWFAYTAYTLVITQALTIHSVNSFIVHLYNNKINTIIAVCAIIALISVDYQIHHIYTSIHIQ